MCKEKTFSGEQEIGTLRDGWQVFRDDLEACATKHDALAEQINALGNAIQAYLLESKKLRKTYVAQGDKVTKDLRAAEASDVKAKQNQERARKKQEEEEALAAKQKAKAKAAEQAAKKAEVADAEYRDAVKALQGTQTRFYSEEMPRVLADLQHFEEDRVDRLRDWLHKAISSHDTLAPARAHATDHMRQAVEAINRDRDIQGFIAANKTGQQKPQEAQYEPYSPGSSISSSSAAAPPLASHFTAAPVASPSSTTTGSSSSSAIHTPAAPSLLDLSMDAPQQPSARPNTGAAGIGEVEALYDYDATEPGELSFRAGQRIRVLATDPTGWWKGSVQGETGIFPRNFVKPLEGGAAALAPPIQATAGGTAAGHQRCRVLYDYEADSDGELSIREGDVLTVEAEDEGWYFGRVEKDPSRQGRFPSNYVEMMR